VRRSSKGLNYCAGFLDCKEVGLLLLLLLLLMMVLLLLLLQSEN